MSTERKKNKSILKLIIIAIVALVIIIGGLTIFFITKSSSSTLQKGYKIGDSVNIGPYDVTINSVKNATTLGKTTLSATATDNNFFVVHVTTKNTSSANIPSLDLTKDIFTLTANGKTYNVNDNITMAVADSNLSNYLTAYSVGGTLTPNITYSTPIVFETEGPITDGTLNININNNKVAFQI